MHVSTVVRSSRPARLLAGILVALALAAPQAAHAIAFVQNLGTAAIGNPSGTTLPFTLTTAVPAGDTVIVSFAVDPKTGAVSCADSKGNAYVADVDVTNGSGTSGTRAVVLRAAVTTALAVGGTVIDTARATTGQCGGATPGCRVVAKGKTIVCR